MSRTVDKPIVIRRGPTRRRRAHGGSWKLAYADFMTALMAFFLLMWLLGSINSHQMEGIAAYFRTPLKAALLGGSKSGENRSVIPGGGPELVRDDGTVARAPLAPLAVSDDAARPAADAEGETLQAVRTRIETQFAHSDALKPFLPQILVDVTSEGLRVQIVDTQNRPMFANASAQVQPYMRDILRQLGHTLNGLPNHIVLAGHTDATQYAGGQTGYSNWELSSDRANASRRELLAGGMAPEKISRVVGMADTRLLNSADPYDPHNRRISIIVLNRRADQRLAADATGAPEAEVPVGRLPGAAGVNHEQQGRP